MMMFLLNLWRGVAYAMPEPDFIIQRTLSSRIHRLGRVFLRHLGEIFIGTLKLKELPKRFSFEVMVVMQDLKARQAG